MRQSLEKKQRTRIIIFTLLLTTLTWLAPVNVGVVKVVEDGTEIPVTDSYLLFDKEIEIMLLGGVAV